MLAADSINSRSNALIFLYRPTYSTLKDFTRFFGFSNLFPEDTLSLSLVPNLLQAEDEDTNNNNDTIDTKCSRESGSEGKERKVEAKETWMLWMGSGRDNHS